MASYRGGTRAAPTSDTTVLGKSIWKSRTPAIGARQQRRNRSAQEPSEPSRKGFAPGSTSTRLRAELVPALPKQTKRLWAAEIDRELVGADGRPVYCVKWKTTGGQSLRRSNVTLGRIAGDPTLERLLREWQTDAVISQWRFDKPDPALGRRGAERSQGKAGKSAGRPKKNTRSVGPRPLGRPKCAAGGGAAASAAPIRRGINDIVQFRLQISVPI